MASVPAIFETMEYGPAPESMAEAQRWLERYGNAFGHFIGGQWTKPAKSFDVIDPGAATVLARVAQGTERDVDAAVQAARRALPAWKGLDGHARARFLYALAREVQKHARLFAVLESMNNGKSIRET
ncbi:MAG: aldehyde dehydrogenase family protein, partial [Gemmatimonadaceae bacterium]